MTIEIVRKYDVLANADLQGYAEVMKKGSPHCCELRVS